jgi:glycosyltransferase involved in cell wall biosynthesis
LCERAGLRCAAPGCHSSGVWLKKLLKSIARSFGYEVSKLPALPSRALQQFLNRPEPRFEPDAVDHSPVTETGFQPSYLAGLPRRLIVEGWRFYPHSYAIVNQWQLLSLSRRRDVSVKVLDAPLYNLRWQPQTGLFEPQAEGVLKSIQSATPDESADLLLRMGFPYDFSLSTSRRTAVFGTSENQAIQKSQCSDYRAYERLRRGIPPSAEVEIVTPSLWSAQGFYKAGFRPEQVHIVPHGVDTATFYPMPDMRGPIRNRLSIRESKFVFLSVGAMTAAKGIDLLLGAFAEVSRKYPHARLILKGLNALHNSNDRLLKTIEKLPLREQERVLSRIQYVGDSFSNRKLALLYQAADCYVSPYLAEGFNMPVLEAAACGLPIICTSGGSTDDFVTDTFAGRIESAQTVRTVDSQEFVGLRPDLDHLIALMCAVIENAGWRAEAARQGPLHVRKHFTWDIVVDRLVRELLP